MNVCNDCKHHQGIPWDAKNITCNFYWIHKNLIDQSPLYDDDIPTELRHLILTDFPYDFNPKTIIRCKNYQK